MKDRGYTLKKELGQHFLHDENVCKKIIKALSGSGDLLEVGPGAGALTKYLLELSNWTYKGIEFDNEKVDFLYQNFPQIKNRLIQGDFLKMPVPFEEKFTLIGNFPYNISGPILFRIYEWKEQLNSVVGMFQKEVAKRVASKEGSKEYGILSVLLQTFFKVEYLFDVSPSAFTPPPKVNSGVLRLTPLADNPYEINDPAAFKRFVKGAFSQRRKQLKNSLGAIMDTSVLPTEVAQKRAEALSVLDFTNLFKTYFVK